MGEVLAIFFLFALIFAVVVLIPASGLWWLARVLRRQQHYRSARVFQGLLMCFIGGYIYLQYSWFFPPDSTFENEFVRITGLDFPESGEIIQGAESGLDPHNDYSSCARMKVDSPNYERLLRAISADTSFNSTHFTTDTSFVGSVEFSNVTKGVKASNYFKTFSKGISNKNAYRFVGFLSDRRTIIFYQCSS